MSNGVSGPKRVRDVLGAAVALLLFAPVMAVAAILVLLSLGRPILFRQLRPGYRGRPFTLYKFRTMRENPPSGAPLSDEQRLTRVGRFLRSTSLDEIPTFWNVLRGDMSLVGPRPLLMEYLALYSSEQARRHEVPPGITGWAQVNGRNALDWDERFAFDVWYVDHHTMWLDFKILLLTIGRVFVRHGISAPGQATMPRFTGKCDST